MNRILLVLLVAICGVADAEEGFDAIFNGTDLTGWEGLPGGWRVEDGAITGECVAGAVCDKTHYLYWTEKEPADFILRASFKLVGGNSGIHVRSEKRPNYDIWGYQADFAEETEWIGCLYQHDRGAVVKRGFKAVIVEDGTRTDTAFADPEALLDVYKKEEWNEYEIACVGNHITLRINGELMCEVEDDCAKFSRSSGVIALQMHAGPPMKVQFKDIRIKILDGK